VGDGAGCDAPRHASPVLDFGNFCKAFDGFVPQIKARALGCWCSCWNLEFGGKGYSDAGGNCG
jgi:hypothetical protein